MRLTLGNEEKMAKILIVDDEPSINNLIKKHLELVGHSCQSAFDGEQALKLLQEEEPDIVLLDIMLPKLNGHAVMGQIQSVPVIFITVRDNVMEKIQGFDEGAYDYITKPFEMLELIARVESVLRRTMKKREAFRLKHVEIDFNSHQVFADNKPVELTPKEYALLEVLVQNRNIVLSRERLLEIVWGYDFEGDNRTVDVHIQKLRKKLGLEEQIKTVYKIGYRLEAM